MKAYKYILGVALLGLMASCSLDLAPISDQSELNLGSHQTDDSTRVKYKDRAAIMGVYENLYNLMRDRQEHWYLDYILFGESRTDNAYGGTTDKEAGPVETNTIDAAHKNVGRDWDRYLEDIASATDVICNVDLVPDPAFTEAERNRVKAEAKIFRAMMIFDFAHWFGNVPLSLTPAVDITSENMAEVYVQYYPKATSQYAAYKICVEDLEWALKFAPDMNGDKTRLSKTVARAILAKLYAEEPLRNPEVDDTKPFQNWELVNQYCQAVRDDGIDLEPDYRSLFGFDSEIGDATLRNSVETILEIQYTSGSGSWVTWMFGRNLANWDDSFTWAKWVTPSQNLMDAFDAEGDTIRKNQTIVWYDCTWSVCFPGNYQPFMYKCRSAYNSILKYRGADIILLQAEALAHMGQKDDAADLVDKVRKRVELPPLATTKRATPETVLDAILHERRLELALEGQRMFDLIRFGKLLDVMNNLHDPHRLPSRPFTWEHALLPIPQTALDNNSNLTANPGY